MNLPIQCRVASAVVLEDGANRPRMLLLKRAKSHLKGEWSHIAGGIEPSAAAWQAALREIAEETGLTVRRLFSADVLEQFYDADSDRIVVIPAFVAYADPAQAVKLNAEHSDFRWVTFAEARELVPFGGQRRLYSEVEREFVLRRPTQWLEIRLPPASP
jgi:dihydroneopterin triphosphate diphosphatase